MRNPTTVLTVIFSLLLIFVVWLGFTLQSRKNVSLENIFLEKEVSLNDLTPDAAQNSYPNEAAMRRTDIIDSTETDSIDNSQDGHYIIVGSYREINQAQQKAEELIKDFNANAIILPPTKEGYHRISFGKYSSREEAEAAIVQIRNKVDPKAWIFTISE